MNCGGARHAECLGFVSSEEERQSPPSFSDFGTDRPLMADYSVKWTAAMSRGNLTLIVAAATHLKQ